MSWEDTFISWAKPPGQTELTKCDNAVAAIKKAKDANGTLSKRNVRVFAQGSYCNRTNVRQDSDVDVCILCSDSMFFELPQGKTASEFGISTPAQYSYSQFKNDVEQALKDHFTAKGVTRGNKAFDIHENTYRVDADAVPCFEYRLYYEDGSYRTGTSFQPDSVIAIWAILLRCTGTPLQINWEAVKMLPHVVTIYVVLSFVFVKWLWRLKIFRHWLVPFPDLQGTWEGELKSKWKAPDTQQTLPPIPLILVVRQTFSSVSCSLFTAESESYSAAAQISLDEESGALHLNYNYTNRPKALLRDRSGIHDGAARLKIISHPQPLLEGEFWTSRCTAGEISVKYRSRKLLESFPKTT